MGDDSCLRGCGFESWCFILDVHFSTLICCKNCFVCLKRPKINKKEAGVGPFFNKKNSSSLCYELFITMNNSMYLLGRRPIFEFPVIDIVGNFSRGK